MHVIDEIVVDSAGRIALKEYFNGKPLREVGIAYDTETHQIIVEPWDKKRGFLYRKIDNKSRLCIKQLLKFIDGKIYLAVDETGNRKLLVLDSL